MNYSSRIDRIFVHGANIQANESLPGTNDPIINSASGSLSADLSSGGTTYSIKGNLTKRDDEASMGCQILSPTPDKCDAMIQGVEQ